MRFGDIVDGLPEDAQEEIYEQLRPRFEKKRRTASSVSKEERLVALGRIFQAMKGFSAPQQRSLLAFALQTIDRASERWKNPGRTKREK